MTEAEHNIAVNNEDQTFMQASEQHFNLIGDEFDQQNLVGSVAEEYQCTENEADNQNMTIHDQDFSVNEIENNFGVLSEQPFAENENEHSLDGDEANNGLDGEQLKKESSDNGTNELGNDSENTHFEKKNELENNLAAVSDEKKWPGWPGESVFRMLVPSQKVGNIIGRKGEYIKKIVEETRARIKVMEGPPGSQVRAVMVSAKEEPGNSLPPAMDGLLRVHRRIVDGLDGDSSKGQDPPAGGTVSTRLLVPGAQAGNLIGKQGAIVKSIQESTNCIVRVLKQEELPVFALQDDRVVEVAGEAVDVHKAIEEIGTLLRKFLVDRSVIPVIEKLMQAPNTPMEHLPPQPWGPHHGYPPSGAGGYGGYNMQYMPPPRQTDNYYPAAEIVSPPDRQPQQGVSAYGRKPPIGVHASSNAQSTPSFNTQLTQHMQVPLIYADYVIGTNGATISYIRRSSGATVTVQETRGVPGEMTVEINGTAVQVQGAQQLIQNFMADAAKAATATATAAAPAPAPASAQATATTAPTQPVEATAQVFNQGYSSYAAPASYYGSAPASAGYATQPGAYGSAYGGNYGY